MQIAIILSSVIAMILVECFKYKAEKQTDSNVTIGKILAEGAESIIIVFVSALVALYLTNASENKTIDEQIYKVLDVAEQELIEKLEILHSDISASIDFGHINAEDIEADAMSAVLLVRKNIKLTDFLYSFPIITRVDPTYASRLAYAEERYEAETNYLYDMCDPKKNDISADEEIIDFIDHLEKQVSAQVSLTRWIECEKAFLNKRALDGDMSDLPKEVEEMNNNLREYFNQLKKAF